ATDPDADRMGLAVKTGEGYRLLSGNETGALLCDYLLSRRKANGTLPQVPVIIKTIVSTELAACVAKEYGAQIYDVLTGFKYIGEVIGKLEASGEAERFVFGFEESYGCLAGAYVRDKDAVVASMLAAEMAAYYKKSGATLADRINGLYKKFGTYTHVLRAFEFPGAAGFIKMKDLLTALRQNLPQAIGGVKVAKTVDYLSQKEFDLPPSDVLLFDLADGSRLIIRPSGTEPLIKMYLSAAKNPAENDKAFARMDAFLASRFQ
ncbi:MAG: phospho-sugar mutase, partial [Firmicutes bacterium]|nr:phospho-sugar mutase [Bacillota bacterium]